MTLAPSRGDTLQAFAEMDSAVPGKLRARISTDEWQEYWIEAFKTRLRNAERDAVRLYPELLRMVGAEDRRLELALGALGVSLEIAKSAVGMYRQVEGLDRAGLVEMQVENLRAEGWTCIPPQGMVEAGAGVASELPNGGGTIPAPVTNGHANGGGDGD